MSFCNTTDPIYVDGSEIYNWSVVSGLWNIGSLSNSIETNSLVKLNYTILNHSLYNTFALL